MIIPRHLHPIARALLSEMEKIAPPTPEQQRFTGSLRKAIGEQSNNQKRKYGHR